MSNVLRIAGVIASTGLSRVSIWRKVREGQFPAPIELGSNSIGWIEPEVVEWQASRPRRRYGASAPEPAAPNSTVETAEKEAAPRVGSAMVPSPAKKPTRKRGAPEAAATAVGGA
jgi:prophage regulatory protein